MSAEADMMSNQRILSSSRPLVYDLKVGILSIFYRFRRTFGTRCFALRLDGFSLLVHLFGQLVRSLLEGLRFALQLIGGCHLITKRSFYLIKGGLDRRAVCCIDLIAVLREGLFGRVHH